MASPKYESGQATFEAATGYGATIGGVKVHGHDILVSACFYGMPPNLETGADGKSLKNPGDGRALDMFMKQVKDYMPKYETAMRGYIKENFPCFTFSEEKGKFVFVESKFRELGGNRQDLFNSAVAKARTWWDWTKAEKGEKKAFDLAKSIEALISKAKKANANTTAIGALEMALLAAKANLAEVKKDDGSEPTAKAA